MTSTSSAAVVDFYPRHTLLAGDKPGTETLNCLAYVVGDADQASIPLVFKLQADGPTAAAPAISVLTATRLGPATSSSATYPPGTYVFSVALDVTEFPDGGQISVALPPPAPPSPNLVIFQMAKFNTFNTDAFPCGPLSGGTTLKFILNQPFSQVDPKSNLLMPALLTGLKVQFGDTVQTDATLIKAATGYELDVVTPDLSAVCTDLLRLGAAQDTASGYVPLMLIFPGGFQSPFNGITFRPISFIRFEPESIDIGGSSPVVALFSPNILTHDPKFSGLIGSTGSVWTALGPSHDVRTANTATQALVAAQCHYDVPTATAIAAQNPLPFQFPVTLSYVNTPNISLTLDSFTITPLAHPLMIPMDSDTFSLPLYGSNFTSDVDSLNLYVYAANAPAQAFPLSILDIGYVSTTEWRIFGPQSAHFKVATRPPAPPNPPAWSKGSADAVALSGTIISSFFLDYYNGATKTELPPPTIKLRTYFFQECTPHLLPRRMRKNTDYVEVAVEGKGFADATTPPKIRFSDSTGEQTIVEIPANYAPSKLNPGEQKIVGNYYGLPIPYVGAMQVSVQIDGTNWTKIRQGQVDVYDICNDAINPAYSNCWTPVAIKIAGLGNALALVTGDVTAEVTFSDDNSVDPGSTRWKALTRTAKLRTNPSDADIIIVPLPPRVVYSTPSFRLQVSIAGQPPVPTSDLCNIISVDFLEPAWCLPNQAPLGGEVRIVGSNFVDLPTDKAKPLRARLAAVLPTYVLENANPTTLQATVGKGSVDPTTISYELFTVHLQIVRLSNTELVVTGLPALPSGIYDIQLGRDGEYFVPCQRLYNVYAWTTDERHIAYGTGQQPTIILPFLSNTFPFANAPIPVSASAPGSTSKSLIMGRVRIGKYSTKLSYDTSTSLFSIVAPLSQRGDDNLTLSYAPDGQRYVSMPNIHVTVFDVSQIEPAQIPAQISTPFKLYASPLSFLDSCTLRIQFFTLAPGPIQANSTVPLTVIAQPNGADVAVKQVMQDRVEFSASLNTSGALVVVCTVSDNSAKGAITRSVWPPQYLSMIEFGSMATAKFSTSQPWPRIGNAFGIAQFDPPMSSALGDTIISLYLSDPASTIPSYLLPVINLDTARIRFRGEMVYSQSVRSFTFGDTRSAAASASNQLALQQYQNTKALHRFRTDGSEYLQEGWIEIISTASPQNSAASVVCVRTPRVKQPGLYSLALSINGSSAYSPVLTGRNIFLYETGIVLPSNSVYAVAGSQALQNSTAVVVAGQFLPPTNVPSFNDLLSVLKTGARLKIGPLSSDASSLVQPLILRNPSVTSNSLTFTLSSPLPAPESNRLYLQTSAKEPFQEIDGLLTVVEFDVPAIDTYPVSYPSPILLTGAMFPYRRERVVAIRLISDNFQLECSGIIQSSSLITFSLPKDGVIGDLYAITVRIGSDPGGSFLHTGIQLALYQPSEFEPHTIVANSTAWASEEALNYLSIWGFGFTPSLQLWLHLRSTESIATISEKCQVISGNELRVRFQSLPPTGSWVVSLVNDQDASGKDMWNFGSNTLTVAGFTSFFPLFGELISHGVAEQMSIITDASSLPTGLDRPLVRLQSKATSYSVTQDAVQVEQGNLIFSIPAVAAAQAQQPFIIQCAVDSHSSRTYGTFSNPAYHKVQTPIWRSVDLSSLFQFVDVKTLSPSYAGTRGGELITITFSASIDTQNLKGNTLEVLFGSVPGTGAKWISDSQITVVTPVLAASPAMTVVVNIFGEQFPSSGFSVYEITAVNPSFGIQSTQALHALGTFLPPGKSGKILLSLQASVVDTAQPPVFLPNVSKTVTSPTPTSDDFWFYLPRGLDVTVAYDIWYCPDGNTVPSLLPTAYRPFQITNIQPRACNISQVQQFTLQGNFPSELQSSPIAIQFENSTDSTQFVKVPAKWNSNTYLTTELTAKSFPDVCDLVVKVYVDNEQTAHYVNDLGTPNHSLISVFRLATPINMTVPSTFGGNCFIVVDNVPDRLSSLAPSISIGSNKVPGQLRTSGSDGNNIPGILFTAPPMPAGSYKLQATLDPTAISWGTIDNPCDSLYYYQPLPKTNAQALGITLKSQPAYPNPFVFQSDPANKDLLRPGLCLINGTNASILDSDLSLQILNLTGSDRLCNGDPVALRTIISSKWRCLRLRRYAPAFSLDTPSAPDALIADADDSDAGTEYPDCREALFGIWRVLADKDGHPYIDPSLQAEIRLGSDRVLIVSQAFSQEIDPFLVEVNHALKKNNGAAGLTSTSPILDLDLDTATGIGKDFLTSTRPDFAGSKNSGVLISPTYQVAVIDAFISYALPPPTSYNPNDAAEDLLYAKSTSSLIVDQSTMYMFATDVIGSIRNNIWYWMVENKKPNWMPLFDPNMVPQHLLDSKGNVRAVAVSPTDFILFQQSQSTGLLRAIVVSRDPKTNALAVQSTLPLESGLQDLPASAGAPVFYSKFTVLYDDTKKLWHIFTVPANQCSNAVHVTYNGLLKTPFIDQNSGAIVSQYGLPAPVMTSSPRFFGFYKSELEISSTSWLGSTPVSISAIATSSNTITFNRYGGQSISVSFDGNAGPLDVHLPALVTLNSGIGDIVESDNQFSLDLKASGHDFKVGDQWLFQVMPSTISSAKPSQTGLPDIKTSGAFANDASLTLELELTKIIRNAPGNSGQRSVQITAQTTWYQDSEDSTGNSTVVHSDVRTITVGTSSYTCDLGSYNVSVVFPAIPQSDDTVGDDGVPLPSYSAGSKWSFKFYPCYSAVESISQPPAAAFVDASHQQAYLVLGTYHGSGALMSLKVDLKGNLLQHKVLSCRTNSEFQIHTVNDTSSLIFRGIITPNVTWANAIAVESDDARQSALYPRLGKAYRMAHLGYFYKVALGDPLLSDTPKYLPVSADLEPTSIHPSCVALAPPGFNTVGAVEVLGAGHLLGYPLTVAGVIYQGLTACSTASKRVNTGIFAPSFIYNIDRERLLAIQSNVQDALQTDLKNQYTRSDNNPFSDGSPIWDVKPLFDDSDYGNDYTQWGTVFKWLYQLALCKSLVDQGATWSDTIEHKILGIHISGLDTHRAAGKDFWALRIGMDRQQKLNQVAMNLRAFKYRYSVHIKEQISLAFPDLTTFTPFGGVSNVVAVSVCHPVTMTQLGKLPLSLLGDLLGDIVTELRYLDSTIYSQVLSHLNSWAILSGLSSLSPSYPPDPADDGDNDNNRTDDSSKQSDIAKLAESLGPVAIFAAGGMLAYSIYKKRSGTSKAGGKVANINGQKNAQDGVRQYNRPSETTRSWAIDGGQPRAMASGETPIEDQIDSFKTDDAVVRDGRDFLNKVDADPKLLDDSPELKEHVEALEKDGPARGRIGSVAEGAFAGLMVLSLLGNWDEMGTTDKVLEIAGITCIGTKLLGSMIGSRFPGLVKGAQTALAEFGEKIGAEVGEKFLASATGRFLSSAGRCIMLEGLEILGPLGNIAFAIEGIISAIDDFKNGKVLDGTIELASSLAMLGAAICDLLVLGGATAAEGVGEVLMVIAVVLMLVELFTDPEGFINMMKELGSEIFGLESPEDDEIDDTIASLKNWALSTTLSRLVDFDVSSYDSDPRIIARNDLTVGP